MWDHNTPSDAASGRPPREGVSRNYINSQDFDIDKKVAPCAGA